MSMSVEKDKTHDFFEINKITENLIEKNSKEHDFFSKNPLTLEQINQENKEIKKSHKKKAFKRCLFFLLNIFIFLYISPFIENTEYTIIHVPLIFYLYFSFLYFLKPLMNLKNCEEKKPISAEKIKLLKLILQDPEMNKVKNYFDLVNLQGRGVCNYEYDEAYSYWSNKS